MDILGASAYNHDSAACLIRDGDILVAAQDKRFTRKKSDARFPIHAIHYCLEEGGISLRISNISCFTTSRWLNSSGSWRSRWRFCRKGFNPFFAAMPVRLKEKISMKRTFQQELMGAGGIKQNFCNEIDSLTSWILD
jgi:carbamoyltransferase